MFKKLDSCTSVAQVVERNTGIPNAQFLTDWRDPVIYNVDKAAALILNWIEEKKGTITIVGDYDSDGINATAILYWALEALNVTPKLRLPRRFSEGYGLSVKIVEEIESGLLITVDNGIAAKAAIEEAKKKGLTVIVTDHHLPPKDADGNMVLPDADIIIDPHIEDKSEYHEYCGAAIAFALAKALHPTKKLRELRVLASIATVTDVMPLTGANRTLVQDGLMHINRRTNVPGLNGLIDALQMSHINEGDYGFKIGPIFNASGRLFDNGAEAVLRVLTTKRSDPRLSFRVNSLINNNETRKETVKESMKVAEDILPDERPIVIYDESFGEGIIGIIAGRLAEEYHCPAIVFTKTDNPEIIKGSGRSGGVTHLKAALDKVQDQIVGYGGHAGAAGLSIRKDNLEGFTKAFIEAVGQLPEQSNEVPYDLELDPYNLDEMMDEVEKYAPYGEGNPQIRFHMVYKPNGEYRQIGDGTHFMIKGSDLTLMGFGLTEKYEKMGKPSKIECVGYLSPSWYNGEKSIKFELVDFTPA
jgi:single-stranded-DNA-specific exonuclease